MQKLIVKAADLSGAGTVNVIARHDADQAVGPETYSGLGYDVRALMLPDSTVVTGEDGLTTLVEDWRDHIAIAIKAEARRRILAVFPDWKQANMTARGVELLRVGEGAWTGPEAAEAAALDGVWAWIKSVRTASDALEVSLPDDPLDDQHWPAAPA